MLIGIDGNEANEKNRVGVGQFAFNVIKELEKIDNKNDYLIYLKDKPLSDFPKEKKGWRYRIFGPGKLWTQIALPIKLFTQKEKLDIFFTPSHYAPRFSPCPTVISLMDLWHHRHPEQFAKKDLYQLTKWEGYSVKKSSAIITISEFSKSEIVRFYHYPKERITVAYPGYDKFEIRNPKSEIRKIREKYQIRGECLLCLGTLQPKKNLERLIEAFARVTEKEKDLTLVIAGKKGWLYEKIFEKVNNLGLNDKVVFTGFVAEAEKPYLIANALAFVFPSLYEGFGIPVPVAMSLGVPVVAANAGSLPEAGGEAAFYCDPESVESIKEAIIKVLCLNKRERGEIIALGFEQVKKFSWEKCARTILETLETLGKLG